MADLNIGVTIGGAVSQTFTNAMRTAERNVNSFRNNAMSGGRQIGDAFRSTEQRLNRFSTSAQNAGASIGSMANAHRRASAAAQQHLSILQRLGNAVRNIRLENVISGTTATIGAIGGAIAGGIAVNHFFDKPKDAAGNFDQIVTRALKKENVYGYQKNASGEYIKDQNGNYVRDEKPITDLKNQLMGIAKQYNTSGDKVALALNGLMERGKSLDVSLKILPNMVKFGIAEEASLEDVAALTATMLDVGVKMENLDQAYAAMVVGGKEGAFELVDMARSFPNLLPDLKQLGFEGQELIEQAVVMAQTARKVAGTSEEAAVFVKNGLEKVSDTATTNRFDKVLKQKEFKDAGFGNYAQEMQKRVKDGLDPIAAQIDLINTILGQKTGIKIDEKLKQQDPAKYEALFKKQQALATSFGLGEMFAEQRAKSNITASLLYKDYADGIRQAMKNTNGSELLELDYRAEMDSQFGVKGQKEAAQTNQQISMGESMAETTKSMDTTLKNIYEKLDTFWGTSAGQAVASVAEPVGTIGGAVGGAATGLIGAGLLTGGTQGAANAVRSLGNVGRSATSLIGRAISSTAGRALGAAGAVGIGGYNAYQTYQNRENLTAEQQGEGYGSAVGGAGGAIAGAMVGAAVGSAVPVIGTVIGGLIGGALGAFGGEFVGGTLGSNVGKFVDKNDAKAKPIHAEIIKSEAKTEKDNEPKVINNTDNSQHPVSIFTNVTVQGNADDPAKIASEIYPHIEQKIKDSQARQQANSVFDNR